MQRGRMRRIEPKHLGPRTEAKAELRNRGRRLQPASGGSRGHHVSVLVDDVVMHGVDGSVAEPADCVRARAKPTGGRLACAERAGRGRFADMQFTAEAADPSWTQLMARALADELAPFIRIGIGQQNLVGYRDVQRIAVEGVAVGKSELRAFDLVM